MAHGWNTGVTMASLACGLVIETLLVVNNYRDRDQDAAGGKRTLVVRLGEGFGLKMYLFSGIMACLCCLYFISTQDYWAAFLPQIYLIPHILTTFRMGRIHKGRALNEILGRTSLNMMLFGLLLSVGLVL